MTADARVERAASAVRMAAPGIAPAVGLVLGSGLAGVADAVTVRAVVDYADLPGFPTPSVAGHPGRLLLGDLGSVPVAVLQGRAHGYEGDPAAMALPIRTLGRLGCRRVVLTAAVGGLDRALPPGRIVRVIDHLAFGLSSPLTGPNDPAIGPRFVAMAPAYDPALGQAIDEVAARLDLAVARVVLAHMPGPQFETAAEAEALRRLGADVVGMSLAGECILARHAGLAVIGLAVVVNGPPGTTAADGLHDETLSAAGAAAPALARLLARAMPALAREAAR